MSRPKVPDAVLTQVLVQSRRRCALCFGLEHLRGVVRGQVAHIDRNPTNNSIDNLVWLCLNHHDEYDGCTSQSKGVTETELRHYRDDLYAFNSLARVQLEVTSSYVRLSPDAAALARHLSDNSQNGYKYDPQVLIASLAETISLSADDLDLAIDELVEHDMVEVSGSRQHLFPTNRLFWETDALFRESDPTLDAQEVARFTIGYRDDFVDLAAIADGLRWSPRRLNPAATYLAAAGLADPRAALGSAPYALLSLIRTARTRRFVRDLNSSDAA